MAGQTGTCLSFQKPGLETLCKDMVDVKFLFSGSRMFQVVIFVKNAEVVFCQAP